MGIPGYSRIIRTFFPGLGVSPALARNQTFDHVLVDINNLLYPIADRVEQNDPEQFIALLFEELDKLLVYAAPQKSVFFALDGPGPRAKFLTQRDRRRKTAEDSENGGFNTLQFTPGTFFMQLLKDSLHYFVCVRLAQPKYKGVQFYVSGADRDGEGEFKMFQYLYSLPTAPPTDAGAVAPSSRVLIVGDDGDLFLYALQGATTHDFYLLRQMPFHEIYSVTAMRKHLRDHYLPADPSAALSDFVLLSLLMGNDYLPGLQRYSFLVSWESYCSLKADPAFQHRHLYSESTCSIDVEFLHEVLSQRGHSAKRENNLVFRRYCKGFLLNFWRMHFADFLALPTIVDTFSEGLWTTTVSGAGGEVYCKVDGKTADEANYNACMTLLTDPSSTLMKAVRERSPPRYRLDRAKSSLVQLGLIPPDSTLSHPRSRGSTIPFPEFGTLVQEQSFSHSRDLLFLHAGGGGGGGGRDPPVEKGQVVHYLEGLLWIMKYLRGVCVNYDFCYPYSSSISASDLKLAIGSPIVLEHTTAKPPPAAQFGLLLLPSTISTNFIPKALHHLVGKQSAIAHIHDMSDEDFWRDGVQILSSLHETVCSVPLDRFSERERLPMDFQPTLCFASASTTSTLSCTPSNTTATSSFVFSPPLSPIPNRYDPIDPKDCEHIVCLQEQRVSHTGPDQYANGYTVINEMYCGTALKEHPRLTFNHDTVPRSPKSFFGIFAGDETTPLFSSKSAFSKARLSRPAKTLTSPTTTTTTTTTTQTTAPTAPASPATPSPPPQPLTAASDPATAFAALRKLVKKTAVASSAANGGGAAGLFSSVSHPPQQQGELGKRQFCSAALSTPPFATRLAFSLSRPLSSTRLVLRRLMLFCSKKLR